MRLGLNLFWNHFEMKITPLGICEGRAAVSMCWWWCVKWVGVCGYEETVSACENVRPTILLCLFAFTCVSGKESMNQLCGRLCVSAKSSLNIHFSNQEMILIFRKWKHCFLSLCLAFVKFYYVQNILTIKGAIWAPKVISTC